MAYLCCTNVKKTNKKLTKTMKKKIIKYSIIAILVIVIADYTHEYLSFKSYNQSPLQIATPDGTNQPYHPSVIYISPGWGGHKYWMAETPYPLGSNGDWNGIKPYRARWENPCIHTSDDGIHWITPYGGTNPIDNLNEYDIKEKNFFSDTHLLLRNDTLECWYRIYKPVKNSLYILRKRSADGIKWSKREIMIDLQDSLTITNGPGNMIISPAIIYNSQKEYLMWYVDKIKGNRKICRTISKNGKTWSKKTECLLSDTTINPWHIDMQFINHKYYLIVYDFNDVSLWNSQDGIHFTKKKILISPSPKVGSFYASGLYRSALVRDDNEFKLYFSAFEKKTALGLMRGPSPDSLSIYSVSGDYVSILKFPVVYLRLKKQELFSLINK